MKTFRDMAGREWTFKMTVASLARVQDATGVDLTQILQKESPADAALQDVLMLFRVLCAALKPQLDAQGVSEEEFGDSLNEETAELAVLRLYESVIDFFHGPKRDVLAKAFRSFLDAARTVRRQVIEQASRKLDHLDFEQAVRTGMESKGSVTSSPGPAASMPPDSLSAN